MRRRNFQNHPGVGGLMGRAKMTSQVGRGTFISQQYASAERGNTGAAAGGGAAVQEEAVIVLPLSSFESLPLGEISDPAVVFGVEEGWSGPPSIEPNLSASAARDTLEEYTEGSFSGAANLLGVGWDQAGDITSNFVATTGFDDFESYSVGSVTGPDINAGLQWNGAASIVTNT